MSKKVTLEELLTREGRQRWLAAVVADDSAVTHGDQLGHQHHWSTEDRFRAIEMLTHLNEDYRSDVDDE